MKTMQEEALAQLIMARLRDNTDTNGQTIDVAVVDGDAFLMGSCDSQVQKEAAALIAGSTYGIRGVVDNIRVRRVLNSV